MSSQEPEEWSIKIKHEDGCDWFVIFHVGVQSFIITQAPDDEEAKPRCEKIAGLFLRALIRIGVDTVHRTLKETSDA